MRTRVQDKEYLEDLENELELADEDETFPYRIGDAFIHLPLDEVQLRLTSEKEEVMTDVENLEEELQGIKEEMNELKLALKTKFGDSINLES